MQQDFEYGGLQNIEKYLSTILKEMQGERQLISVSRNEGDNIVLEFSDNKSVTARSFVKQFKKRRYESAESAVQKSINHEQEERLKEMKFEIVGIVETKKVWLVFWSKS